MDSVHLSLEIMQDIDAVMADKIYVA